MVSQIPLDNLTLPVEPDDFYRYHCSDSDPYPDHDHDSLVPPQLTPPAPRNREANRPQTRTRSGSGTGRRQRHVFSSSFPRKLYQLVDSEDPELVCWQEHGLAFSIKQPDAFVRDVLPKYFKHTKLASFQRQLNLYGFRRLTKGNDQGAYFHPHFQRGKRELLDQITRVQRQGDVKWPSPQPTSRKQTVTAIQPLTADSPVKGISSEALVMDCSIFQRDEGATQLQPSPKYSPLLSSHNVSASMQECSSFYCNGYQQPQVSPTSAHYFQEMLGPDHPQSVKSSHPNPCMQKCDVHGFMPCVQTQWRTQNMPISASCTCKIDGPMYHDPSPPQAMKFVEDISPRSRQYPSNPDNDLRYSMQYFIQEPWNSSYRNPVPFSDTTTRYNQINADRPQCPDYVLQNPSGCGTSPTWAQQPLTSPTVNQTGEYGTISAVSFERYGNEQASSTWPLLQRNANPDPNWNQTHHDSISLARAYGRASAADFERRMTTGSSSSNNLAMTDLHTHPHMGRVMEADLTRVPIWNGSTATSTNKPMPLDLGAIEGPPREHWWESQPQDLGLASRTHPNRHFPAIWDGNSSPSNCASTEQGQPWNSAPPM